MLRIFCIQMQSERYNYFGRFQQTRSVSVICVSQELINIAQSTKLLQGRDVEYKECGTCMMSYYCDGRTLFGVTKL
jgi:hypothetical protein